jgi:hypothetical protein
MSCKAAITTNLKVGITCTHEAGIITRPDNKVISKHYGFIIAYSTHRIAVIIYTIIGNYLTLITNGSPFPLYFTFTFNFDIKSTMATGNYYFALFIVSAWGYPTVVD